MSEPKALSRRERELLDIVYGRGEATAVEVREDMQDAPSYSAVRGLIRVLEEKGHLRHRRVGVRNVYRPTRAPRNAGRRAMKRALETFFRGDVHSAVSALLDVSKDQLSPEEHGRLLELIESTRQRGR